MRLAETWRAAAIAALALTAACGSQDITSPTHGAPAFAKGGGTGPTVRSTSPSGTAPGTTLDVRIFGSGFDNGTQATFAIDSVPTPGVVTNRTTFISSSELVANITVSDAADLTTYDVIATTTGGKKGIGTELFLVSYRLTDLGGHATARGTMATDVNTAGVVVGYAGLGSSPNESHAMRWRVTGIGQAVAEDLHSLLRPAFRTHAYEINEAGDIVGFRQLDANTSNTRPFLLSSTGVLTELRSSCGSKETIRQAHAYGISENGAIMGTEVESGVYPIYWAPGAICAERLPVPGPGSEPRAISADGMVIVGTITEGSISNPVRWNRRTDGSGWDVTVLPKLSDHVNPAAVAPDGTIVGWEQVATLVRKRGSTYYDYSQNAYHWPGGTSVARLSTRGGDATWANDVDAGRIVGMSNDRVDAPAEGVLWRPDGSLIELGTFVVGGGSTAMAIRGNFVVGYADVDTPGRGIETHAVFWTIP